ncbi:hypothetical protein [Silvibacterium sp.]|uniref:hypothetical protein n=1 Tax=Silvibacterium sp. TaxID=1964179 RepID=UPI0039E4AA4A
MARFELSEETRKRIEEIGSAELVVGIAGAAPLDQLTEKISGWLRRLPSAPARTVVVFGGVQEIAFPPVELEGVELLPFIPAPHDPSLGPWAELTGAQITVMNIAALLQARACVVLHPDLAVLEDAGSTQFAAPILEGGCDLVMPGYPEGKYDGLLNKGLVVPLAGALCGRRAHTPLAYDFGVSTRLLARLAAAAQRPGSVPRLLWPSIFAGMDGGEMCEASLHVRHSVQSEGLELSAVLGLLAGSLFQEAEINAAQWQRVRGSQIMRVLPPVGDAPPESSEAAAPDPQPLIDSFVLGFRNLEEVWRIALPPISLFELQRISRLPAAEFHMPDELWARIVYDFAVAWHVRRIGRTHLLGAMTPLYLGWVASYVRGAAQLSTAEAQLRVEQLAQAFEASKPYFVSRWRWPDRVS